MIEPPDALAYSDFLFWRRPDSMRAEPPPVRIVRPPSTERLGGHDDDALNYSDFLFWHRPPSVPLCETDGAERNSRSSPQVLRLSLIHI